MCCIVPVSTLCRILDAPSDWTLRGLCGQQLAEARGRVKSD
jgi:hypothetical protein